MFNVSKFHYTYSRYAVFRVSVKFCLRDVPINEDIYIFKRTIITVIILLVLLLSITTINATVRRRSCFSVQKCGGKHEQEESNTCVVLSAW